MALVLTRSVGERILIGEDIVIEVRAVTDGHQVRIAIDAPRQVAIHRAEIYEAISAANTASSSSADKLLDQSALETPDIDPKTEPGTDVADEQPVQQVGQHRGTTSTNQ